MNCPVRFQVGYHHSLCQLSSFYLCFSHPPNQPLVHPLSYPPSKQHITPMCPALCQRQSPRQPPGIVMGIMPMLRSKEPCSPGAHPRGCCSDTSIKWKKGKKQCGFPSPTKAAYRESRWSTQTWRDLKSLRTFWRWHGQGHALKITQKQCSLDISKWRRQPEEIMSSRALDRIAQGPVHHHSPGKSQREFRDRMEALDKVTCKVPSSLCSFSLLPEARHDRRCPRSTWPSVSRLALLQVSRSRIQSPAQRSCLFLSRQTT